MQEADLLVAEEVPTSGEIDSRSFSGRGVRDGYGHWGATPEGGGFVSIDLGCHQNDEFWLHLHLTRAELQAMLDALPEPVVVPTEPCPWGWDKLG